MIPSGDVPTVCRLFENGEWLKRPDDPIGGWSMEPSHGGHHAAMAEPLRPTLSNGRVFCTLPEPIEAAPLAVWRDRGGLTKVTWPKGLRDGIFEKMRVSSCRDGTAWQVETIEPSESVLFPLWRENQATRDQRFGAHFPCASQKSEWEQEP